jgi:hypothetical protein
MPIASLSNINVVSERTEPEIQDQDVSPFAKLEKQIRDGKIESSKSTDLASEGSVILGGKVKKTGRKKSKSVQISEPSSIQIQPIQASEKDTNSVNLDTSYEKMVEESIKIIDEKRKRYPENNLPIP